jgi:hypothetical protein
MILGKNPSRSLAEALNRMAKLPVPPAIQPVAPPSPSRGGDEMQGSYELPPSPRPLPFWWPR